MFFSYLIFVIIAIITTTSIYVHNRRLYAEEIKTGSIIQLENRVEMADEKMRSLLLSFNRITEGKSFNSLIGSDRNDPELNYKVYLMQSELKSNGISSSLGDERFVYFKNIKMFVSDTNATKYEKFSDVLSAYGGYDFENWSEQYLSSRHFHGMLPSATVTYDGSTGERLMYIYSYPANVSSPSATLVSFVDKKSFEDIFTEGAPDATVFITENDKLLVKLGGQAELPGYGYKKGIQNIKIDGKDYSLICVQSNYNRWKYIQLIPNKLFLGKVRMMDFQMGLMLFCCLLLILVLVVVFAAGNISPIRKLIYKIEPAKAGEAGADELEFLDKTLIRLIRDNDKLNDMLSKSVEQMCVDFLYRVLKGNFKNAREASLALQNMGVGLDNEDSYVVFLVSAADEEPEGEDEQLLIRYGLLKQMLSRQLAERCGGHVVDCSDCLAVICAVKNYGQAGGEAAVSVKAALEYLREHMKLNLSAFAGEMHEGIIGIFYSYNEACETMDAFGKVSAKRLYQYSEIERKSGFYYYPIAIEEKLINFASIGEKEEVIKIVDLLYYENFVQNTISNEMLEYFKSDIISTVVRIVDAAFAEKKEQQHTLEFITKDIVRAKDIGGFFKTLNGFFSDFCDLVVMENKNKDSKIKAEIMEYLDKNYNNSELCLSMIADDFNFSEAYFSRLFKGVFCTNYSNYVESLRIEKSLPLFTQPKMTINTIAVSVGYQNAQVFRRAFKRQKGFSPSEFKASLE